MEQSVDFGRFRCDIETGTLWPGAQEVRLTPKASAVLNELVKHTGRPVSKDGLFATVWGASAIAVLPFADMSPGRDQDYLCEGLAEELINALTHIDGQSPMLLAQSLRMVGRHEALKAAGREGILRAERILALNPRDERAISLGSLALFDDGQLARTIEWSERSLEIDPEDLSALISAACLRSRSGRKDKAIEFLERVFAQDWGKRDWVETDPDYDILRDDPRFKKMVEKRK